jgi:hypothetical protein
VPGVDLVAGPPSPAQAEASLRALGDGAPAAIAAAPVVALVDCGRLHPASPAMPWARAATLTLVVTRPRLDDVVALPPVVDGLRAAGAQPGLVCVGDQPFHPVEVAEHAGLPLLGVVAHDATAAALVGRGALDGRWLQRSRLARSVADLARALAGAEHLDADGEDAARDRDEERTRSGAVRP